MGLGNIERKIRSDSAYQRKEAELLIEKLDMMIENLDKMKDDLKKIEKENKKEITENKEYYNKIVDLRKSMGLPEELGVFEWREKPSFKEKIFGGNYYNELSNELLELIMKYSLKTGGILALSELVLILNRKRPGKNVLYNDILKSVKILLKKKLIDNLIELDSGILVVQMKQLDWSKEQKIVLEYGSELGYMTIEKLMVATSWNLEKISVVLEEMEKSGLVLKETSAMEGIKYWFPGLQQN